MKIRYNAPITLTFALLSACILLLDQFTGQTLILRFFSIPGKGYFNPASPLEYIRLFSHILGHAGWAHLLGNFSIILLIGPILEEKYGSAPFFMMILTTALVTGVLNVLFFPTGLLGASGAAFMMILLAPFTNTKSGDIPLTFILIVILYITKQVYSSFQNNSIAEFAHLAGGACGSIFGFFHLHREPEIGEGISFPEDSRPGD
ncbi:MAG: rhomboid family intramembrane serine protease [Spirochaetes bacterium]|nr:MAG: rhomboid family intramembrane serine protease [Spirochaetota bacterium]